MTLIQRIAVLAALALSLVVMSAGVLSAASSALF